MYENGTQHGTRHGQVKIEPECEEVSESYLRDKAILEFAQLYCEDNKAYKIFILFRWHARGKRFEFVWHGARGGRWPPAPERLPACTPNLSITYEPKWLGFVLTEGAYLPNHLVEFIVTVLVCIRQLFTEFAELLG